MKWEECFKIAKSVDHLSNHYILNQASFTKRGHIGSFVGEPFVYEERISNTFACLIHLFLWEEKKLYVVYGNLDFFKALYNLNKTRSFEDITFCLFSETKKDNTRLDIQPYNCLSEKEKDFLKLLPLYDLEKVAVEDLRGSLYRV